MVMHHGSTHELIQYNNDISGKLNDICVPLFKNFGFSSFGYTRIREDGGRLVLETNKQWLEYYSEKEFEEKNEGAHSLVHNLSQTMTSSCPQEFYVNVLTGDPQSKLHDYLYSLDLWNSISIYVHMNKFIEVFHLSTTRDSQNTMEFCFNKKDLLQRFLHYFRDKISDLDIEKAPFIVDKSLSKVFTKIDTSEQGSKELANIEEFIKETSVDKFYLKTHGKFITRREAECLHYLALGKSCKEIAKILKISPRTVETYFIILKTKTHSTTKNELVTIAHKNYISDFNFLLSKGYHLHD